MTQDKSEQPTRSLDRAMGAVPLAYSGPGGAVAVLKDGEVMIRHAWGWADVDRRIPFTPQTLFRICSITKQFTVALMLERFADPAELDADIRARLPLLDGAVPSALDLANNQSGLRDYWATAMLCGSPAEAPFDEARARHLVGLTRSLQFTPGTRFSYCNQNFRLLSDVVAAHAGVSYGDLLRRQVFDPACMPTARLCADTATMPDGTVGYEGTLEAGFRAAVNRIHWTGDAGIGASLDDMIAWERHIDAARDDPASVTSRLAVPQHFRDGGAAAYGLGLNQMKLLGRHATGHGGGLRGWRSFRCYLPAERISIVVLFNHMADARAAALDLLATLVDAPAKPPALRVAESMAPSWGGSWQEPETGLVVRVEAAPDDQVRLHFGQGVETLDAVGPGETKAGNTVLRQTADGLWLDRAGDNQSSQLLPLAGVPADDVAGVFHNSEFSTRFTCVSAGGTLYGAFAGFLGEGTMQIMIPVGADVWRLPMPRALDHAAPGDWTLDFRRGPDGTVTGLEVGCWLARHVTFVKGSP